MYTRYYQMCGDTLAAVERSSAGHTATLSRPHEMTLLCVVCTRETLAAQPGGLWRQRWHDTHRNAGHAPCQLLSCAALP